MIITSCTYTCTCLIQQYMYMYIIVHVHVVEPPKPGHIEISTSLWNPKPPLKQGHLFNQDTLICPPIGVHKQ